MAFEELGNKTLQYPKGAFIFKKDDFTRDLYVIKSGKVRAFNQVGMRTITLTELGPGAVFGEVSALDGGPRSATVQALEDTEVFVITPAEVRKKTAKMPEWFLKIARILVQRLRETDKRIESEGAGNSAYNIAVLLGYFIACEGKDEAGAKVLEIKKTQNDIMDLLQLPFKAISEIFESLQEKGIIKLQRENVVVPDVKKLEEYAKMLEQEASKDIFI
jgi:CRP/FNR family transcriptional regulator, cyclic AMP receptor protein